MSRCYSLEMPRKSSPVTLGVEDRRQLEQWQTAHGTPQQVALRCRLVLSAADGLEDSEIAEQYQVNRHTVALWRKRICQGKIGVVWQIASGRGRKHRYDSAKRKAMIDDTLRSKPKGMTHWSCRTMARTHGVSHSTVNRLWQSHNLKPHLQQTFKLSRDAKFLEKLTDVVGLYLNPPQKAMVLCVDEKSQIQAWTALNRAYRSSVDAVALGHTTINAMEPPPCLPHSTHWTGK